MKKVRWKILILSLLIVYVVAFLGSLFTSTGTWYESVRPLITPPNYVFPIVWNILFFLIAIGLYLTWISKKKEKAGVLWLIGINLFFNLLWSVLFFGLRLASLAFVDLVFLWGSIFSIIYFGHEVNKKISWLFVPYFLWVSFAGILNWMVAF